MTDLKPCPFCGKQPDDVDIGTYFVECPSCGVQGPISYEDGEPRAKEEWNRRAIEAEVLQAQEPVAFPSLPAGIVMHPQLGELYDRLQVQQYAMKYAGLAAPQPPAPFQKRPYNGREISVQDHNEIVDALLAKVAEQNAEIAQLKTVPMKYRRMEFNAQLQAKVAEQSEEFTAFHNRAHDRSEKQSALIKELTETRDALWETQRALCNQVYERDVLIERCRDALSMPCDRWNKRQSLIVNDVLEAIAVIVAHKKGLAE